jgi:dolichol-phosphate mannosyltransferase
MASVGCSSSTTPRPTAPATSPTGWRPSTTTSRCSIATESSASEPQALPQLLAALATADLALGSRYVDGGSIHDWGAGRRAISRLGSRYARIALGVRVHDLTGGFKAWRRAALEGISIEDVSATGYAFQVETTYRAIKAGFRVVEVPISFRDRRIGASKMSRAIVFEAAWQVPAMRLRRHL